MRLKKKVGIGFGIIIVSFIVLIIISQVWMVSLTPEERLELKEKREADSIQNDSDENIEVKSEPVPKTYPPNTIGGIPIEPGVFYRITEDGATKVEKNNQMVWKDHKEISNEFDKQKLAELKDSVINDPLYDVVFDPVVVRQAEKGILLSQKAFKGVLDQCNSIESYSDYLVFAGGLALVQDEVVQALEEINDAMISLELSGYDSHHIIGPLIKETRQLAEDAGNCIIDVQNKYDN